MNQHNPAEIPIDNNLNVSFNSQLQHLLKNKEFSAARGMILAALQLANAQGDAPQLIVAGLVAAYCEALDAEITTIIGNAQTGLTTLGIAEEDVVSYLAMIKAGSAPNGNSH